MKKRAGAAPSVKAPSASQSETKEPKETKETKTSPSSVLKKATPPQTLFVIITALLIDLLAFTIILPLFPRLLKYYEVHEPKDSLYRLVNAWIVSLRSKISDQERLDIILFGGLTGSLFSFLQFLAAPVIGRLSDKYGRRTVLLFSMIGNAVSMLLWMFADRFEVFLLSRIVGGLTEGNVQMSIAMISDISTPSNRSRALALVGIAFSAGFTFGPPIGAYLTRINLKDQIPWLPINAYSTPALFALVLIVVETVYLFLNLPETLNRKGVSDDDDIDTPGHSSLLKMKEQGTLVIPLPTLSLLHFFFLFIFSGMEFTLTFLTYDRFAFTNISQGLLLSFMGVLTALIQGGWVRRKGKGREPSLILQGITSCALGLFTLAHTHHQEYLYLGVAFLALTNGTVVMCLTALASFSGSQTGHVLGVFRSTGQLGRSIGPLVACVTYWVLGSERTYDLYALLMGGVALGVSVVFYRARRKERIKKE